MDELDDQSISRILGDFAGGEEAAVRALLPKVYGELRRLAAAHLRHDRAGHTLQPTALVHEAYIRLSTGAATDITGRQHFYRLASKVMRQILVDHARAKDSLKRGGGHDRVTLGTDAWGEDRGDTVDVMALDEALLRLEGMSPEKARLVELRFFGGLSEEQAAEALGISRTEASRQWRVARTWLADELRN